MLKALWRKVSAFNDQLAVRGTMAFNTMWMFYAFALYGALGAVFPNQQGPLLYWSNWIQLVSLPLIGVGLWLMGRRSEQRAQETHDAVMEELALGREALRLLREESSELKEIIAAQAAQGGDHAPDH